MKTDQNSNMQGTLNKRISMKKRRNAKRALLALNLVAVIFTTTVFSNPVSVLSEEVSTDTVQSIENSPGTDAQIAEQADVQQNTAEAAQAVEAPAAEAPAAENSAEAAKAEEPSGVNAPAENAMSAEMNAAEDGVVSTDDGASSASAVQSADTSSASNGSFEDAGAGNTDGTKDGIIENDAEGLNEAEGTAANEESEDAASQEQLTYEDEHVKISVSYTDGRAFTADSILTRTYLDSDEKNAVLSAVNAQISKGNSADTVSDTAENTESSGSAPVASTTATTVEYSVAGFHALMLSAKNQDGSDTTTEGDVTFSAEFKKGLNDAGYASREETTENNEAGGDGSLTTTTTRCETSWKIYTVTEKNLTDITDITDAHNTHYEMDENGTLKSASFRGALPQTVAFVQIVKKTVTETTTQKETEKATEKETQKVTEKYTEKITGKAAEKTTETETEKEDVKAEVPASAAMPAVAFDQKVTTENGTVMVHIDAEEGAFEEGTSMTVTPVTRHDILDKAIDAAGGKGAAAAMDITFTKADGTKTEPLKPIHVKMISPVLNHAEEAHVVHVADSGTIDVVARKSDGKTIESTSSEAASSDAKNAVSFESDSFSVYAIVYTVDFEYSVNGKMYQFSLSGGEKIALSDLIEVLGIIGDTNNGEKAAFNSVDSFLKEVADVEFSDESLVKVTQNEEGNDWTLESLAPFDTEESLTITMKNGDVVMVKVTDDQKKWHVDINLYDYNGSSPATAEELALISGKTYAVVAVISDKTTNQVLGYRVSGASFAENASTTSCDIGLDAFKTLGINAYDGKLEDTYGSTFAYDPNRHNISIRLYEGTTSVEQWPYQNYRTISALPAYANGFQFLESPYGNVQNNDTMTTTLNMKRAYDNQFVIRLNVDPSGLDITENDRYYVLVTVDHETTPTTYAYAPVTVSSGQTIVDIPVTDWYDQNGNLLPNEKFTGNETVNVKLYTTNKDGNGNKTAFNSLNEIKNSQVKVLVAEGDSVNRYNVYYGGMQTPVDNDDEKKTYYYSTIDFHAPTGNISKGDIDRLLDDATDFGYYTERYIGHSGDIEATIGADYLNTVFESDFAYSSANLNVNRLKVLKIYTDENGDPVQKQVTIKIKQNGVVVGEKTGTTDENGKLELEFEQLGPGEYDIVEIIDGQEITGQGTASVSGQTINYNFSIDKAHFANNLNVNYFGTIGEGMDLDKLKTMIQKASRVDVVILTDTEADKARIDAAVESQSTGKKIDVVLNGTDPYKQYDIKSDMVRLRQLSDDLASAQSSDTIRVINIKASEISDNGLSFDDDGRYIVLNIEMDQDTFCPYILLDGKLLESDYGQSGKSNSSKVLFNLRNTSGGRYNGLVNTNKQGAGIILAPDANAHILGGPFGGTIITYQVNRQGNELHSNNPNQIQTLNAVIQNVIGNPTTGILQLSKQFSDNTKDKVTYFTFKVKLENTDASKINGKTFPATGLKIGDTVTFNEQGEALVQVRAGNTVAIANLPAGTTYTVEEIITPETAHFQLDRYEGNEGTIEAGKTSNATVYNKTIPLNAGFEARKTVNGKTPTLQQRYYFKLDEYKNAAWANIQTQPNIGSEIKFAKVDFTEAGTYFFKIYEDAASVTDLKPDNTVYIVKVEVTEKEGEFQFQTTYYEVKDNDVNTVTGEGLGQLNNSNVEPVVTALFNNKDQIKVGFAFSKAWLGMNANVNSIQSTDLEVWDSAKAISVVVKRIDPDNPADNFTLTYDIGSGDGPFQPKENTLSVEEKTTYQLVKNTDGNITTFNMGKVLEGTNSNGKPYTYYVEETMASGGTYVTYYGTLSEGTVTYRPDYSHAGDGDIIINLESCGYELPSTGGPGTRLFTILGSILILGAGALLWRRRRFI